MGDLIRRSDAIKSVLGITMIQGRVPMDTVIYQITIIPAVEPKHGEWIEVEILPEAYDLKGVKTWASKLKCSKCGFIKTAIEGHIAQYRFCPTCGAKMVDKDINVPNKLPMSAKHEAE